MLYQRSTITGVRKLSGDGIYRGEYVIRHFSLTQLSADKAHLLRVGAAAIMEINHALSERAIGHYEECIGRGTVVSH